MELKPGAKLGPYEILSRIGAGGMGEVWKARDTRLDRIVAIKTSAARFSERFETEARAVAALNHPHICTLYDVGPDYLVMEYVEGPEIKGPVPLDQALRYAIQLASALEAAHRKGITHRDLKPANILVTKAGIKVLDFGLAKIERTKAAVASDETATRTALTQEGSILGTLQYMAPEQLQGKTVDGRADIFSFGRVLYERLTGKRAFDGANTASVIAAIMERPAPSVNEVAPAALDRVLRKCLTKDPDERWQSAHDLKTELTWIAGGGTEVPGQTEARPTWWIGATAFATLLLAGLAFLYFRPKPPQPAPMLRATILPPPKTAFRYLTVSSAPPAISPDGRRLVFGATSEDGRSQLYLRPLDSATAHPLAGTENAIYPFWSPDGRWIGFAAEGKLKKIDADGGPATAIADAPIFRGVSWSGNDEIVFAPSTAGPLRKVAASGGSATPVTSLADSPGLNSHRWPWFLPDGRHFLYIAMAAGGFGEGEIRVGSADGGWREGALSRPLGKTSSQAVYSEGYILFTRDQTLLAQPFDAARLVATGEPMPLVEGIIAGISNSVRSAFAVSSGAGCWSIRVPLPAAACGSPGSTGPAREPARRAMRVISSACIFRRTANWRWFRPLSRRMRTSGFTIWSAACVLALLSIRQWNWKPSGLPTARRSYSTRIAKRTLTSTAKECAARARNRCYTPTVPTRTLQAGRPTENTCSTLKFRRTVAAIFTRCP
jgi:tRNA A-37 threonylcarbamoyl transferase component Bud32